LELAVELSDAQRCRHLLAVALNKIAFARQQVARPFELLRSFKTAQSAPACLR
jgi:hypothetical protein